MCVQVKNDVYTSDVQLSEATETNNEALIFTAKDGQVMNISMVNLMESLATNDVYGTLKDKKTNKEVVFGSGRRFKNLIQSSSNELELKLSERIGSHNRFLLHIAGNRFFSYLR